ncbi:putative drug resistance transporter [Gordonia paraffinivorans NBRC 108238]|uniref:Drug resistance transporter n=1 Tax=Gordonia paraffinivorans NBRC 108238 TaxID=1223543 RepID=A0ABQ0IN93_9ACTN|nr:multidrug effflux MFS transporter [Gordonia paraffinivorans]GAC85028.1 putative drug resistance transporter [Gordonia paraffinivorans NBRC 108238]
MTSSAPTPSEEGISTRLLLTLALLSATAPIATDLYLPSFIEVQDALHTDATHVQLTLTAFLIGVGIGQVIWGPISDRFGRRLPLILGSAGAVLSGVVVVAAPTIEVLIGARFVQALAAASGMVIARAVIADRARGFAGARAMTIMMTIQSLAPVLAPLAGGLLAGHVPWRGVLAVILATAVLQLVGAVTSVPETLPAERRVPRLRFGDVLSRFTRPAFMAYVLTQAFAFGALMSYISSSSFVYQNVIGTSELVYGLAFAANACGMMIGGIVSSRLSRRHVHPATTIGYSLPVLILASFGVLGAALSSVPVLLVIPLFVLALSIGFIFGNAAALAMEHTHDAAGAGSAVLGGIMFLVGGALSPLGGLGGDDTAVPMACIMITSSVLTAVCFAIGRRVVARNPESEAAFAHA